MKNKKNRHCRGFFTDTFPQTKKLALPVKKLLIQPEHHKNTQFWLNKEFNPAKRR